MAPATLAAKSRPRQSKAAALSASLSTACGLSGAGVVSVRVPWARGGGGYDAALEYLRHELVARPRKVNVVEDE